MKPLWTGTRPEIIFFDSSEQRSHATLKRFLTYLKVKKVPGPIRFAFIDEKGPLIPNLSLRDNISLDSIPSTVSSDKEFTLEDYLDRRGNDALTKLYNNIKLVEDFPGQVDSQTLKIAALIKGLLQDGQYLFLENPERFLDQENLKLFINALLHQLSEKRQTLLIKSTSPSIWSPYITQWVKESTCPTTGKINQLQSPVHAKPKVTDNVISIKDLDKKEKRIHQDPPREGHQDEDKAA
jgi:hypothetical protein